MVSNEDKDRRQGRVDMERVQVDNIRRASLTVEKVQVVRMVRPTVSQNSTMVGSMTSGDSGTGVSTSFRTNLRMADTS